MTMNGATGKTNFYAFSFYFHLSGYSLFLFCQNLQAARSKTTLTKICKNNINCRWKKSCSYYYQITNSLQNYLFFFFTLTELFQFVQSHLCMQLSTLLCLSSVMHYLILCQKIKVTHILGVELQAMSSSSHSGNDFYFHFHCCFLLCSTRVVDLIRHMASV